MTDPIDRNPLIIPDQPDRFSPAMQCPKCSGRSFSGRNIQGVITRKCNDCGQVWEGGLPRTPILPGELYPPDPNPPLIDHVKNMSKESGVEEIRRRPSPVQGFRKGAPIPSGEE